MPEKKTIAIRQSTILFFVAILMVAGIIILFVGVGIYTDYLWFSELDYASVFLTILKPKIALFFGATAFFILLALPNLYLISKNSQKKIGFNTILIILLIAILFGRFASEGWEVVLKFFNSTEFNIADPIFNLDLGFYFFTLPFYNFVWGIAFSTMIIIGIIAAMIYLLPLLFKVALAESEPDLYVQRRPKIVLNKKMLSHLVTIAGIMFILLGIGLWLHRYSILYSASGVVYGAGYTDVNISLGMITLLSVISFLAGLVSIIAAKIKRFRLSMTALTGIILLAVVGSAITFIVQQYVAIPDEYNLEKQYLENNIKYTRLAYGLEDVSEIEFPVEYTLTMDDIQKNSKIIDNIRLWDWRPLTSTYKQVQLIRTYYDFNDVDVDRYVINGDYKQIMLSAREVNYDLLPEQRWVNVHLVFTHGYGVAMSPVREVSKEGMPLLYIRDIPPQSDYFDITQPEIYFGELTNTYSIVKTLTEEFDYPKGDTNIQTTYQGKAGIELSSVFRKIIMMMKFRSVEILFSNSITPESKILFNRNIMQRASMLAPFLEFDQDPYVAVHNGKLYWIIDAYTVSDRYPYSEPYSGINYIRNSVKVVIDAYNGDTTFYIIEEEPMIKTYAKIFPELFKPLSEMPEGLQSHIRYPVDLFKVQSEIYKVYHMQDPRVFYNKEDVWEIPQELYERTTITMEPYYLMTKLPGEKKEEFILLLPFTPRSKNNIIGWMAARSDSPNYGKRIVYMFPKEKLIYGPMQIEARIDQDPDIARLFTLWDQIGTRIIRGNLLVIPVEDSLLYVEPIYLRAEQAGALPELKRVIVSFGDRITMQETLDKSLGVIFGAVAKPTAVETEGKEVDELIDDALEHYEKSEECLRQGDWTCYGNELAQLKLVLNELAKRSS